ncbi:MAG: TIGR03905 family TSCPD domain-containing protein [Clostridiales bacterium]|jgi:uncharacterized protein (TIGR03905 family)|nr:TIGR03905 family TSCPD domain-containing protein [Clostridiales bacterium]
MRFTYKTKGVCSRQIEFDFDGLTVDNVVFSGGCPGNTQGLAALTNGRPAQEVIGRIKGIRCGFKPTSCPDQLALALEAAIAEAQEELELEAVTKAESER